jgi:hypothetical protein
LVATSSGGGKGCRHQVGKLGWPLYSGKSGHPMSEFQQTTASAGPCRIHADS